MKPIYYIAVLFISFLSLSVQSQSLDNMEQQLIGSWTLDYATSQSKMGLEARAHYNKMSTARKTQLEKAYKGRTMVFNSDNSFTQQLSGGHQVLGTWEINNDLLILKNLAGRVKSYQLKSLTETSLILKKEDTGNHHAMFSELYFTKN